MNARPLFVALSPSPIGSGVGSEGEFTVKLELDPRTWQPGDSSFTASIRLPSKIEEGEYNVALWFPDASESLQTNPLYAVQLANDGIWDESTGYNILGKVTVDRSVAGSSARSDSMQVEELLFKTAIATSTPASTATVAAISGEMISNLQISNGPENILLSFDYVSGNYNAVQLFVDLDQNPDTGYVINGIGAEALFENDTWSIHAGTGTAWSWEPTEDIIAIENTGSHVNWDIRRSLLNSHNFDFVIQLVDSDWNSVFISQKITFTVK
jgi:hypothetical protein